MQMEINDNIDTSFKIVFFYKLHNLLEQERHKKYLRWSEKGDSFLVLPMLLDNDKENTNNAVKSIFNKLSVTKNEFARILKKHFCIRSEILKGRVLYLKFQNEYFKSSCKDQLGLIKEKRNTLEYLHHERESPSAFNLKTVEILKKILEFLKRVVSDIPSKKVPIKNILIYENFEDRVFVLKVVKSLMINPLLVDYTFQYNEFVDLIRHNKYKYIVMDSDLFEIHRALSPDLKLLISTRTIITYDKNRHSFTEPVPIDDLAIPRPYTYDQILNMIKTFEIE